MISNRNWRIDVLQCFVAVIGDTLDNVDPIGRCTGNWSIETVLVRVDKLVNPNAGYSSNRNSTYNSILAEGR